MREHLHSASASNLVASPAPFRQLWLASASPRRAQLLSSIGLPFSVVTSDFEEPEPSPQDEREPARYVERLARAKAAACDRKGSLDAEAGILILAADTTVWHAGRILNKPRDAAHARAMLQTLRGDTHQVLTGVCLRAGESFYVDHEVTTVRFGAASDRWIERYVATGDSLDKAGAYAAQGRGGLLIERIEGDFSNVVGLPLALLSRMLSAIGAPVEDWWPPGEAPTLKLS